MYDVQVWTIKKIENTKESTIVEVGFEDICRRPVTTHKPWHFMLMAVKSWDACISRKGSTSYDILLKSRLTLLLSNCAVSSESFDLD